MYYAVMLLFILQPVLLLLCVRHAINIKTEVSKALRISLSLAAALLAINGFAVFSPNAGISHILFCITMVLYDITVSSFFWFTHIYTRTRKIGIRLFFITSFFFTLDSIFMLINIKSKNLFYTTQVTLRDNSRVYSIITRPIYAFRWSFVIVMVSFLLLLLLYKATRVPHFYRWKYISVVCAVLAPLALFILFIPLRFKIDLSNVTFGVVGLVIYYFCILHTPKELISSANSRVISGMQDPVVTLDYEGHYIDMNESAEKFFGISGKEQDPSLAEAAVCDFLGRNGISLEDNYGSINIIDYKPDDKTPVYINIKTSIIYDEQKARIGYFVHIHDYTAQENKRQKEWYRATHDTLTGLCNRSAFLEYARILIEEYPNREYVIVCSDIENFKLVNDIFGEDYGDDMLKRLSVLLEGQIRGDEVLGRLGNDIFAFIIEKKHLDQSGLINVAQTLIPEDMRLSLQVHIQYGVYEISKRETPVNIMCERALIAIKNVKGRLEDAVVFYDDKLRQDTLEEQELISEIEPAIENGEFVFFIQPQVDDKGKVLGGEALVRWKHPKKGLVPPGKFIGILEKKGLIPKLDRAIWEQACAKLKEWKEMGWDHLYISVNISPRDFYYLDVYQTFVDLVKKYDIDSKNLRLEITETAVMQNLNEQIRLIDNVRNAGFVVEMDDFGSGYSSLNTLKDIHMDILKIDMGFLGHGIGNERSRTILEIVIDLAKRLHMPTVIEGVEQEDEVEFLKSIGCHVFQGYYFAKPMDVSDFEANYMKGKDMTA